MEQIRIFVDRRQSGFCVYCFGRPDTRDHVPPKVFLDEPYPENLPVVPCCRACNEASSLDEEYVACVVEVAVCGGLSSTDQRRPKVARKLAEQHPLSARIAASVVESASSTVVEIEVDRVSRVLEKVARGLWWFECGVPAADMTAFVRFAPVDELGVGGVDRFAALEPPCLFPEVGSRMMLRTLDSGSRSVRNSWVQVQLGRFSYAVEPWPAGPRVKMLVADYLAVEVDLRRPDCGTK